MQTHNVSIAARFQPTGQKVLIEPIWQGPQVGLIHVPEAYREDRPEEGTVVAIGKRVKTDARIGDRVLTDRFAGKWVEIGGARYRLLEPQELLAVIEEAA